MKKVSLIVAMLVLAAATSFGQVFDFSISNETGYDIKAVYVAPAEDDEWGDDVLGEDILEDGDFVEIEFTEEYEAYLLDYEIDLYDLRVEYTDGTDEEYYDLKLEEITELTLEVDKKGNGVATWE